MQQVTTQLYTRKHKSNTHFQKNKLNIIRYIFGILHQMLDILHQSSPYREMLCLLSIYRSLPNISRTHSLITNILKDIIHISRRNIDFQQQVHS